MTGDPTSGSGGDPALSEDEDRPTVLIVGQGDPMAPALLAALNRYAMFVETAPSGAAVNAAFTAAPDLIVLMGDAVGDDGGAILRALAEVPATGVIPVVILADDPALDARLRAFRHGAVAVVPRSASVDEMARRIAELALELPERPGARSGVVGEATVDELVELLSKELRSGILSVTQPGSDGTPSATARVVLRADRPVSEAVAEFVDRLKPMIQEAKPLAFEFHESVASKLQFLDMDAATGDADLGVLSERRIVLVDDNPANADVLAQELRAHGATVVVTDGQGAGFERARELDPDVVIIDEEGLEGWGYAVMSQIRRDVRLRWASLLVVRRKELWSAGASAPDVEPLAEGIAPLVLPDDELRSRVLSETKFETRLEMVGPTRMLRALSTAPFNVRVTVRNPRVVVELDLTEGLVVGARCYRVGNRPEKIEGHAATAQLLALSSGRTRVERRDNPATANVMAPVADAIKYAERETPPVPPSIPPPSMPPEDMVRQKAQEAMLAAANRSAPTKELIGQLEGLLGELRASLPKGASVPAPASSGRAPGPGRAAAPARPAVGVSKKTIVGTGMPAPPPPVAVPPAATSAAATPAAPPAADPFAAAAPAQSGSQGHAGSQGAGPEVPAPAFVTPVEPMAPGPSAPVPVDSGVPPSLPPAFSTRGKGMWLAIGGVGLLAILGTIVLLVLPSHSAPEAAVAKAPEAPTKTAAAPTAKATAEEGATGVAEPEGPSDDEAATVTEDAGVEDAETTVADGALADAGEDAAADAGADAEADAGEPTEEEEDEELAEDGDEGDGPQGRRARLHDLVERGNYHRRQRSWDEAEAAYKQALALSPRHPRALAGMARTEMGRGHFAAAESWARKLIVARSHNPANRVLLGDILKAQGRNDSAKRAYERALSLNPRYAPARRRLKSM